MLDAKYKKINEKLKKTSIGIAGLGGLGSNVAISLARAGIGRLVLVDFDIVEKTNLNRQYYFLDQVGKKKTLSTKENIRRVNPTIDIQTFDEKLIKGQMEKRFTDVDIVIEALDNAVTKTNLIEEILTKLPNKKIISASGVSGYGNSDRIKTSKLGNLFLCHDEEALSSEKDVLTAPKVALIANWQANIALELILGDKL